MLFCTSDEFDCFASGYPLSNYILDNPDKVLPERLSPYRAQPGNVCPCCGSVLYIHHTHYNPSEINLTNEHQSLCLSCDYWYSFASAAGNYTGTSLFVSRLKKFDLSSVEAPIRKVISHIRANPDSAKIVHPRVFESLCLEIMTDYLDCELSLTANSADGGCDLIGYDSSHGKVLIEVKRYTNKKLGVNVVRHLAGVLVRENSSRGFVVGTTDFTGPAAKEAKELGLPTQNYSIQLDLLTLEKLLPWLEVSHQRLNEPRQYDKDFWENRFAQFS